MGGMSVTQDAVKEFQGGAKFMDLVAKGYNKSTLSRAKKLYEEGIERWIEQWGAAIEGGKEDAPLAKVISGWVEFWKNSVDMPDGYYDLQAEVANRVWTLLRDQTERNWRWN